MAGASKNVAKENADQYRDLLVFELWQLVEEYLELGKGGRDGRRGGGKGKTRAARG